jgi:hypothetical protein
LTDIIAGMDLQQHDLTQGWLALKSASVSYGKAMP